MRLEFRTEHMLRGGPPVYDPGGIPQDRPYQPFDHPLASRPDRPPALPIPGPDRVLDLGCGASKEPGALGLDVAHVPGVDLQCDLFGGIPIRDHSVDLVWAHQFLEHVPHRLGSRTDDGLFEVLGEVHRILRKGGLLRLDVPHAHYAGAYWDPTHTRFFLPETFNYLEPEGPLRYYHDRKFRVLALRFTYGAQGRHVKDYHLIKHISNRPVRNMARWLFRPRVMDIVAILQAV
ncbi:MAG: class I SAM-dependent methyltransferase [Candidatus Thermoplasmatota archaeon]|jgi:predicted SAM-dependent methyltransferase|nr:class I SAM-dependent methyltransferase [Candidatus Thermoplasmatota archaeon]MCL5984483.1 class I SAM-dependent methyltransferase [Candidatus Thermoplasmatota archaeon]